MAVKLKNFLKGMSSKSGLFEERLEEGWALGCAQWGSFCRFLFWGKTDYLGYYWGNFMNHRIHALIWRLSWRTNKQTKTCLPNICECRQGNKQSFKEGRMPDSKWDLEIAGELVRWKDMKGSLEM